ncbi:hypothetical protein FKW77_003461 [Venturia effusa]|uniref:Uncharacterized protein n=1 Tax=Venturia effusa TaxID=50376 RepID=A0A517L8Z9_9PEZI|nr:hypothetical protein FKW77_003461 [Venturia effusa]
MLSTALCHVLRFLAQLTSRNPRSDREKIRKGEQAAMRFSKHLNLKRKASPEGVEDRPDSVPSESPWRRILHPLKRKRQSTSTDEIPLQRQISGHSTVPSEHISRTSQSSSDMAAYYSAKPLPPVPTSGISSPKASTTNSKIWSSASSPPSSPPSPSPSQWTTTYTTPMTRPQEHERLILTPTSRYPVGIAGHLYEPEDCKKPEKKKRRSMARKISSKCLRGKPEIIRELSTSPPLPRRMDYRDCFM